MENRTGDYFTMSNKFKFIWIDDDPDREIEAKNIGDHLKVDVEFSNVKGEDLQSKLNEIISKKMPDIILMDHRLDDISSDNGFKTGSTAAEVIREKWPQCPIVCITEVELVNIDFHKQSIYEEIIEFNKISDHYSTLSSIAHSFKKIQQARINNLDELIDLLEPPEGERERLKSITPDVLRRNECYADPSLGSTISEWVRHTLIEKPGFLYDRLWAATLIGIKEDSFKKVEKLFEDAKYRGIFADEGDERWWQSKLREIMFMKFPDSDSIYPWELGRELEEIEESDFSKCHASGEDYPETVAYTDEAAQTRVQMRLRYTVPHPGFKSSLFFEEMRMMREEE